MEKGFKPKLDLDLQLMCITLHFRPWKGKIGALKTVILVDRSKIFETIDERIAALKQEGKYKRRTITHVSFSYGAKL